MRIDHYDLQGRCNTCSNRRSPQGAPARPRTGCQPGAVPCHGAGGLDARCRRQPAHLHPQQPADAADGQPHCCRPGASGPAPAPAKPAETGKGEQDGIPNDGLDNRQRLIKLMIEAMLGHEIELPDPIKPTDQSAEGVPVPTGEGTPSATEPDQLVEVTDSLLQKSSSTWWRRRTCRPRMVRPCSWISVLCWTGASSTSVSAAPPSMPSRSAGAQPGRQDSRPDRRPGQFRHRSGWQGGQPARPE